MSLSSADRLNLPLSAMVCRQGYPPLHPNRIKSSRLLVDVRPPFRKSSPEDQPPPLPPPIAEGNPPFGVRRPSPLPFSPMITLGPFP